MRKMLSKTTSSGETAFPWKLHMVLEESTFEGFDDIISWIGNNAFKVHDPIQFEEKIMQRFFNQTQYKSFQRQLNIYGFTRVKTAGKATGSYTHPLFIRGNPDACSFMVRVKVKKKGIRKNLNRTNSVNSTDSTNSITINKGSHIKNETFDHLIRPISNGSSPLHRRFKSLYESSAINNGIIEPTPLRSVSPASATKNCNGIIEPTPFRLDSLGSSLNKTSTMKSSPIISNINVVPCDSSKYIDRGMMYATRPMRFSIANNNNRIGGMVPVRDQEQHRGHQKRRYTNYNNVDLDLDTIFDDDDSSIRASNGSADPFGMENDAVFDQSFHMVEESISGNLANRTIDIY